ncbi:MAG: putative toxin-antitoxin system toxin component, PIN family [Spirosomaceae bacterium]|jgi:putative PIN family toxin of toxin-antitoxin system|nr:putative toxin-antitoxin system toxin component, PIN family [Spirosomataceae bacterium]
MRVVIDTNQLLTCFSVRSKSHWLWQAFKNQEFELCVTTEILDEYAEIFEQKYSFEVAELILDILLDSPNVIFIKEYFFWGLIKEDLDDNKFVDCALMANASCIVTEDRHFNILKSIPFPKINILKLDDFKYFLESN